MTLTCSICHEESVQSSAPEHWISAHPEKQGNLSHRFHINCIQPWIVSKLSHEVVPDDDEMDENETYVPCPICRDVIVLPSQMYHLFDNPDQGVRDSVNTMLLRIAHDEEIIQAVDRGDLEGIRGLIQTQPIFSESHRGIGLLKAVERNRPDILVLLLQNESANIMTSERDEAFEQASGLGYLDMVTSLFFNRVLISTESFEEAFCKAAANGHLDVVQFLYSNTGLLSVETLDQALSQNDLSHLLAVQFIDDKFVLSTESIERAFCQAAANGYLDVVQFLYNDNSENNRLMTSRLAGENDRFEVVDWLLGKLQLSPEDRGMNLAIAVEAARNRIIQRILNDGEIDEEWLGLCLEKAAQKGLADVVELLLQRARAPILQEHLDQAIANSQERFPEIAQRLCQLSKRPETQDAPMTDA